MKRLTLCALAAGLVVAVPGAGLQPASAWIQGRTFTSNVTAGQYSVYLVRVRFQASRWRRYNPCRIRPAYRDSRGLIVPAKRVCGYWSRPRWMQNQYKYRGRTRNRMVINGGRTGKFSSCNGMVSAWWWKKPHNQRGRWVALGRPVRANLCKLRNIYLSAYNVQLRY